MRFRSNWASITVHRRPSLRRPAQPLGPPVKLQAGGEAAGVLDFTQQPGDQDGAEAGLSQSQLGFGQLGQAALNQLGIALLVVFKEADLLEGQLQQGLHCFPQG